MRTTIDLPPAMHQRVRELAARRGISVSRAVVELTARGLEEESDEPLARDPRTDFPVVTLGHPTTSEDVAALWDDE